MDALLLLALVLVVLIVALAVDLLRIWNATKGWDDE